MLEFDLRNLDTYVMETNLFLHGRVKLELRLTVTAFLFMSISHTIMATLLVGFYIKVRFVELATDVRV